MNKSNKNKGPIETYQTILPELTKDNRTTTPTTNAPFLVHVPSSNFPSDMHFSAYKNTMARKQTQRILAADSERIQYVATNFGEGGMRTQPINYAVAVIDKEKKTVTFQDIPWFNMVVHVKALENDTSAAATRVKEDPKLKKNLANLGESFGTRKRKQAIKAVEKGKIHLETLAGAENFIEATIDQKRSVLLPIIESQNAENAAAAAAAEQTTSQAQGKAGSKAKPRTNARAPRRK